MPSEQGWLRRQALPLEEFNLNCFYPPAAVMKGGALLDDHLDLLHHFSFKKLFRIYNGGSFVLVLVDSTPAPVRCQDRPRDYEPRLDTVLNMLG